MIGPLQQGSNGPAGIADEKFQDRQTATRSSSPEEFACRSRTFRPLQNHRSCPMTYSDLAILCSCLTTNPFQFIHGGKLRMTTEKRYVARYGCSDESVCHRTWDQSCGDDWKQQTPRDVHIAEENKVAVHVRIGVSSQHSRMMSVGREGIVVAVKPNLDSRNDSHTRPHSFGFWPFHNIRECSLRFLACGAVADVSLITALPIVQS
jgi:hypothetical protein